MFKFSQRAAVLMNRALRWRHFPQISANSPAKNVPKVLLLKAFYSTDKPPNPEPEKRSILGNFMGKDEHKERTLQDEELQKLQDNSWKTMRNTLIMFGVTFTLVGSWLLYELGKPKIGEDGLPVIDEYADKPVLVQHFHRMVDELNYYKRLINEPSRDKLLPDPLPYPYYQPPYTLVLELTDVLVHPDWTYNTGWRFKKRPGIEKFLENIQGLYEVVVYTAEMGMTVFPIIEALDPKNMISYKLVRDATHFVEGVHVKDLDRINRDLSKVIVVDWNSDATRFHQDNVLRIPRWTGSDDDTTLYDLSSFLAVIAHSEVKDVREVLRHYRDFDDPLEAFKDRQRQLAAEMANQAAAQASRKR